MGQTLYAIIAMMVVSLFSLQQQQHALRAQLDMIDNEVATVASAVAVERLEEVGALAFDQATKGGATIDSTSELTSKTDFGTGEGKDQPGDDLDDFDGASVVITRDIGGEPLRFQVDTTVDYAKANAGDQVTMVAGKFKVVRVEVQVLDLPFESGVSLAQVYSCKSSCRW